ncbi:MAG TPA: hypothetical protein VGJ30_12590, partial [Candidatus Angelobacter sp.]
MIHQRVNQSCELLQPAALRDNGKYASLVIPGTDMEIYSPELAQDDFLSYSKEVPEKLVKLARKSGFGVRPGGGAGTPSVVDLNGNGQCPNLEEALQTAETQRRDRLVQVQSGLYHVTSNDNVTPPSFIHTPDPAPDQKATGASPGPKEKIVEGIVILQVLVDREGNVTNAKVVR